MALTQRSSHTSAAQLTMSLSRVRSRPHHVKARLLPAPPQQAKRSTRARDRLPGLDPLLEVWEHDLTPLERAAPLGEQPDLPWEGASFSWEPASRNAVPFSKPPRA